jgi:hypothetical protein
VLLCEEGVSFHRLKTWKQSRDRAFEARKHRILHLSGLMDGTTDIQRGDPDVVLCVDEFGPLNLQPILVGSGPRGPAVGRCRGAASGRATPARTASGSC